MSDENPQAVVDDPKVSAQPDTTGQSARDDDDYEKDLSEFTEATKSSEPKPEPKAGGDDLSAVKSEVMELRKTVSNIRYESEIAPIIKAVRGDVPVELYNDEDIHDWINREAKKDNRLAQAWVNKEKDPAGFNRIVRGLERKLAQRFSNLPDNTATADRAAVTAAVRGASTKAPEAKPLDLSNKTDAEARDEIRKNYGYIPRF